MFFLGRVGWVAFDEATAKVRARLWNKRSAVNRNLPGVRGVQVQMRGALWSEGLRR